MSGFDDHTVRPGNEVRNEPIEVTLGRADRGHHRGRGRVVLPAFAGLALLLLGAAVAYFALRTPGDISRVKAVGSRLIAGEDDGGSAREVARRDEPELVYHVTLAQVPEGRRLRLHCVWTDASGSVAHTNDYETRPVQGAHWTTHCRCRIGAAAPLGAWSVEMSLAGRQIARTSFEVK